MPALANAVPDERNARGVAPLGRGSVVGRYVIWEVLGSGGMGIVFLAFDPSLSRRVALKLFNLDPSNLERAQSEDGSVDAANFRPPNEEIVAEMLRTEWQSKLLQEARSAARVDDPHVVAVFDAGLDNGRVYIAMEVLPGQTLRQMMTAGRAKSELWIGLLDGLRGLYAVHNAGLVHGDFKPDNLISDAHGLYKILDFGLAQNRARTNDKRMDGAMVGGTPSYLAPELRNGAALSVRSDLFAWGVSVYECLCGERPFAADGGALLLEARRALPWSQRACYLRLPKWQRELLAQALADDPEQRPSSALPWIEALQVRLAPRTGAAYSFLAITFCLVMLGAFVFAPWQRTANGGCEIPETLVAGVWNEKRATEVSTIFRKTGSKLAESSLLRLGDWFTLWQNEWRSVFAEVCGGSQSISGSAAARFDRKMSCLHHNLANVQRFADSLAYVDRKGVESALSGAANLDAPERCLDPREHDGGVALPENLGARQIVAPLVEKLQEAESLASVGAATEAEQKLGLVKDGLRGLDWAPLEIGLRQVASRVHYQKWNYDASFATGQQAYLGQLALGSENAQLETVAALLASVSYLKDGEEMTLELGRLLDAMSRRSGIRSKEAHMAFASLGASLINIGRPADAEPALLSAIAILEKESHPPLGKLAAALVNLSCAHSENGNPREGEVVARRALRLSESFLGPAHPELGRALYNLALALNRQGRFVEAAQVALRGRTMVEGNEGAWAPRTIPFWHYWLEAMVGSGRENEALANYPQVVELFVKTFGSNHVRTLDITGDWADSALAAGNLALARKLLESIDTPVNREIKIIDLNTKFGALAVRLAMAQRDWKAARRILMERVVHGSFEQILDAGAYANLIAAILVDLARNEGDRAALRSMLDAASRRELDLGGFAVDRSIIPYIRAAIWLEDDVLYGKWLAQLEQWISMAQDPEDPRAAYVWALRSAHFAAKGDSEAALRLKQAAQASASPELWAVVAQY
jgi:tetratricopeptide (TPR) repeat protein